MDLYKCKKCGKDVPFEYAVCPFCQTPRPEDYEEQREKKHPILFALLVIICALFVITGIMAVVSLIGGDKDDEQKTVGDIGSSQSESKVDTPKPEQKKDSKTENFGDLGDYYVEIKDAKLARDYENNPAIVITYSWTNNSEDTTSAMAALIGKAFQDGVELETAIIADNSVYDVDNYMKEIRPGATLDVQLAYVMTSETSTVEYEISELISFSGDTVTKNFDPSSL